MSRMYIALIREGLGQIRALSKMLNTNNDKNTLFMDKVLARSA